MITRNGAAVPYYAMQSKLERGERLTIEEAEELLKRIGELTAEPAAVFPMQEFDDLVKPLIKWLNDNTNPHSVIIIDTVAARLLCADYAIVTTEYIAD